MDGAAPAPPPPPDGATLATGAEGEAPAGGAACVDEAKPPFSSSANRSVRSLKTVLRSSAAVESSSSEGGALHCNLSRSSAAGVEVRVRK